MRGFLAGVGYAAVCAVIIVCLCAHAVHAREEGGDLAHLQANLDNVLLEDFIRFVGRFSGRNIIYRSDRIPKVRFNVYSQEAITEPQLLAIFRELLNSVGLYAVSRDDALYIFPLNEAKKIDPAVRAEDNLLKGSEEEITVTVFQLDKRFDSKLAVALLKGLQSPVGRVQDIPQANAVLIKETREKIETMINVLESIKEVSPSWRIEIFQLQAANAESVVKMINSMYADMLKRRMTASVPIARDIPWSNSILVAGSAEDIQEARELIEKLDHMDEGASGLKVYRLQNAKATTVATVLQSLVQVIQSDAKGKRTARTVSEAFKVSADPDTNSLVVAGNKDVLPQIEDIISKLDQPQDQVFIESLIMETTLQNSREFGVEWMLGGLNDNNVGTVGYLDSGSNLLGYASPVMDEDKAAPAISALPGGFTLGVLGNIITYGDERYPTLGAFISFAKGVDGINILSTPQLMTLDNSEAEVFVGENRAFVTGQKFDSNNNPVQTYEYKDIGISLKVVPHINKQSGLVRLEVETKLDQVAAGAASEKPTTLKRSTKTTVQLLDGSTVVISGLVQNNKNQGRSGIPVLSNIPLLGWLFKREVASNDKTTLMVFLSAKIIRTMESAELLTKEKRAEVERTAVESDEYYRRQFELFPNDDEPGAGNETLSPSAPAGDGQ